MFAFAISFVQNDPPLDIPRGWLSLNSDGLRPRLCGDARQFPPP